MQSRHKINDPMIINEAVLYDAAYVKGSIEAILFASGEAVEISRLASAIGLALDELRGHLDELIKDYEGRGIEIIRLGDKCQMRTKAAFFGPVNALMSLPEKKNLTSVLLETLAIIAFKQPVTKAMIEEIRGLSADHAVNRLLELELIRENGRLDAPGRPILFETTEEFLRRFGVSGIKELITE